MKTDYIKMSLETQKILKITLSLFPDGNYNERTDIIRLSYTDSEPKYPEKILNLKWSIGEGFKLINLKRIFNGNNDVVFYLKYKKIFSETKISGEEKDEIKKMIAFLWNQSNEKLTVSGKNFQEGVSNLFSKTKEMYSLSKDNHVVPTLLIQRIGDDRYNYFKVFKFNHSKKIFEELCVATT